MGVGDEPADIYVISDLHIGRGKNPETGRFYSLEAFFYDDDLLKGGFVFNNEDFHGMILS